MASGLQPVEPPRFSDVEGITEIVRQQLCHACGACVGVCPVEAFQLNRSGQPVQVRECIHCGLCTEICSGARVDYEAIGKWMFGENYKYGPAMGTYREVLAAYAKDEEIRWAGASGGVPTQLLVYLLETGRIRGALVAVQDPEDPARGAGTIARSREEIIAAAQSRYTTTPSLSVLREIADEDGPFAVCALPSQIHAIRMLQMHDKRWKEKISLCIGLICQGRLPCRATRELGEMVTPPGKQITRIDYRKKDAQGWPHNTTEITFDDGSRWRSPYMPNQTVALLTHLYPMGRCLTCLDVTAEFADLAVGDPWIRTQDGSWMFSDPAGWSSVIVRTPEGEKLISEARAGGILHTQTITAVQVQEGQSMIMLSKKRLVPLRLKITHLLGLGVPEYKVDLERASADICVKNLLLLIWRLVPAVGGLRRLLLRLAFSPVGMRVMDWRKEQKKRRDVQRIRRRRAEETTFDSE